MLIGPPKGDLSNSVDAIPVVDKRLGDGVLHPVDVLIADVDVEVSIEYPANHTLEAPVDRPSLSRSGEPDSAAREPGLMGSPSGRTRSLGDRAASVYTELARAGTRTGAVRIHRDSVAR
jgi:hypothetical protein